MIIKFESLDEFYSATSDLAVLYDPKRKILYSIVAGIIIVYKPKNSKEVEKMKSWRTVKTARLIPTVIPDNIESFSKLYDEFKEDAKKIIGKKIVDAKIGDNGIDIVLEDGTTLEIYCLGAWAWSIDKETRHKDNEMDESPRLPDVVKSSWHGLEEANK